jgi:transcriptional regulator with XRE-family HTH domain
MSTVGDNIFNSRKELGLTQEELAKKMGYKSKSTINKIELGINDIPQGKIVKFAEVLFTTPAYLMGWEEEDNSPAELELTEGEKMWLELYNRVSDDTRDLLIKMGDSFDRLSEDKQKLVLQTIRALGDHK